MSVKYCETSYRNPILNPPLSLFLYPPHLSIRPFLLRERCESARRSVLYTPTRHRLLAMYMYTISIFILNKPRLQNFFFSSAIQQNTAFITTLLTHRRRPENPTTRTRDIAVIGKRIPAISAALHNIIIKEMWHNFKPEIRIII